MSPRKKPQLKATLTLDWVECLGYLENNGHTGIEYRMGKFYADEVNNGGTFLLMFPEEEERDYYEKEGILADLDLIKETWQIESDSISMYCFW